jgi:hypothetical protein
LITAEGESTGGYRPLRYGVYIAVRTFERRHKQAAAREIIGVANRGNQYINGVARFGKRREFRRHHDCGDIVHLDLILVDGHSEPLKHINQRLDGELGRGTVAGAV